MRLVCKTIPKIKGTMDSSELLSQLLDLDKEGKIEELEVLLKSLPEEIPTYIRPYFSYWHGKCAVVSEKFAEAIPHLYEAVKQQPRRFHAHYLLGVCLVRKKQWLDARNVLEKALELNPSHAASACELAKTYQNLSDYEACVRNFESFIHMEVPDPVLTSAYWRSKVMLEQDHVRAAQIVNESLQSGSDLSTNLFQEWLKIAGGLLVNCQYKSARLWFSCLQDSLPTLQKCSQALPKRPALIGRVVVEMLDPSDDNCLDDLINCFRSVVWMPVASYEIEIWHSWLHASLWHLAGKFQRMPSSIDLDLSNHLATFITSLKNFLGFELRNSSVIDELESIANSHSSSIQIGKKDVLKRPKLLHKYLNNCHDVSSLQNRLSFVLDHWNTSIVEKNRGLIESELNRFSDLLLSQTNMLLIHSDPSLVDLGVQVRERALEFLRNSNKLLLNTTSAHVQKKQSLRRWLLIATDDLPQCFFYRVRQKEEQLQALGFECRIVTREQLNDWGWSEQLIWADAVMICRLPGFQTVLRSIEACRHAGLPTFYDVDDLIIDPEYCPPDFDTYGGTLAEEQHRRFILDVPLFAAAMKACDEVVVSTKTLARRWSELQKQNNFTQPIHILPNLAPPALRRMQRSPIQTDIKDPVRLVFASGTKAHKKVWTTELAPALAVILGRYTNVQLDLIGHLHIPLILQPFLKQIRCKPYTDYDDYLAYLSRADIGLVVLEPGTFTDAKSAIRWMEFSYLGLASILSPTQTYHDDLVDNRHALFASGSLNWMDCIERLLQQPRLRFDIATQAHELARELFSPKRAEDFWSNLSENIERPSLRIRRKKLLVVNVFFYPQSVGGATRIAQDHVLALNTHLTDHYDVTVLCIDQYNWQDGDSEGPLPLQVHDWNGARVVRMSLPGKPWSWHHDGLVEQVCRDWFKRDRFDLIHAHSLQVLTAAPLKVARELDIPYCITLHDAWWLSPSQFLTSSVGRPIDPKEIHDHYDVPLNRLRPDQLEADKKRRKDLFEILNCAEKRLAVSLAFANLHRNAGLNNVEVMENHWQPMNTLEIQRQPDPNKIRLCFIGGMALHKGFAVLQAACCAYQPSDNARKFKLTVVDGYLSEDDHYECIWGVIQVKFVPKISMDSMSDFYANQDVLLAPSIWPESYGLVTREALSAGLCVVASDIGALAEPIHHGFNGYKVPAGDTNALVAALEQLAEVLPVSSSHQFNFKVKKEPLHQELDALYCGLL